MLFDGTPLPPGYRRRPRELLRQTVREIVGRPAAFHCGLRPAARVMKDGKVVAAGTRDAVMTPPRDACTEPLLSPDPGMDPGWLTGVIGGRGGAREG